MGTKTKIQMPNHVMITLDFDGYGIIAERNTEDGRWFVTHGADGRYHTQENLDEPLENGDTIIDICDDTDIVAALESLANAEKILDEKNHVFKVI